MSFLMFKLILGALALGLLAVVVLIVRQVTRKPQTSAPELPHETAPPASKLRLPGLGKKAPEAEPNLEEAASAPARRRQLQSFADAERGAAEAEAIVLPAAVAEPETETATDDRALAATPAAASDIALAEPVPGSDAATETSEPDAPGYDEAVLGRLEEAFEALQDGELTLDAYRARIQAEHAAVEEHIAAVEEAGDDAELEAALAAREAVLWCLDWAEEQASALG